MADLRAGLSAAREQSRATVLTIETDPAAGVPGYESWWDVPPAEVSESEAVRAARRAHDEAARKERWFL
jgi:3D-(3,5/4)-trihydroxycyclohexane-1,2-dione acylhydrolase (decyclizing)